MKRQGCLEQSGRAGQPEDFGYQAEALRLGFLGPEQLCSEGYAVS